MLPKLLSFLGLACLAAALTSFLLPHLLPNASPRAQSDRVTFDEGDATQPSPTPTPTTSSPTPTPTSTNANTTGSNANAPPSPRPTPQPTATPTPILRPTPIPSPTPMKPDLRERYIRIAALYGDQIGQGETDGPIWQRVRKAIGNEPAFKGVRVSVSGGAVTLTGSVPDAAAKERVLAVARGAAGAGVQVSDETKVQTRNFRPDLTLPRTRATPPDDDEEQTVRDGAAQRDDGRQVAYVKTQSKVSDTTTIEIEYPLTLKKNESNEVRVTIIRELAHAATPSPTAEIPGNEVQQVRPQECQTPHAGLRNAYGPDYDVSLTAKLGSGSNSISVDDGEEPRTQTLDQPRVTWHWHIKPGDTGPQVVNLLVTAQWTRRGTDRVKASCIILNRPLQIQVTDSLLSDSNLNKAGTILGLLGTFLQLPSFIKRRKGADKERRPSSHASGPAVEPGAKGGGKQDEKE